MPINYSKYPPNWKEIRERILTRAGNKCEFCGLDNNSIVFSVVIYCRKLGRYSFRHVWFRDERDATRESLGGLVSKKRVVLTIAHLDHDETNFNVTDDRLRALCQICHLRYDAPEKIIRIINKSQKGKSL